jgi:hypothetical protein
MLVKYSIRKTLLDRNVRQRKGQHKEFCYVKLIKLSFGVLQKHKKGLWGYINGVGTKLKDFVL